MSVRAGVLVIASEVEFEATRELVTAAKGIASVLEGPLSLLVPGPEISSGIRSLPVDTVLAADVGADFDPHRAEAAVEAALARTGAGVVLFDHSSAAMAVAPAVGVAGQRGFASDVIALDVEAGGDIVATRSEYGGRLHAEIVFPYRDVVILTLRPGAWMPTTDAGSPAVVKIDVPAPSVVTELVETLPPPADVDLASADVVIALGRGVGGPADIKRFEDLAGRLGAEVAVSRPLVDPGWASRARLVGESGQTVRPKVYVALGISGAPQHVAGMRDARTIIAVNSDPKAPIFDVAHYGAVTDASAFAESLASWLT